MIGIDSPTERDQSELGEELAMKLGEIANKVRMSGLFTHRTIAGAFMAIGMQIAKQDQGGVQAAEWLRGIADEIEREQLQ